MSSKNSKRESREKTTGRYINLRTAGVKVNDENESVSHKAIDITSVEKKIIQKIHAFPLSKQQKVLDYAETLEREESFEETEHQTIWDMVKDIIEEVPKEDWDKLPTDGSINVDHYLYGHKKKIR